MIKLTKRLSISLKAQLILQKSLLVLLLLPLGAFATDRPKEIRLWTKGAPSSEGKTGEEAVQTIAR